MSIIDMQEVSKAFGTEKIALDQVTFSIEEGEIFGFLGPSGAGKTTTINILTGQLKLDSGQALLFGKPTHTMVGRDLEQIGLMTDLSGYYEKMTLYDNLLFYGKFYGKDRAVIDDLLEKVGLAKAKKTQAAKLSTGMRQRMLLVRALINNPKLLFLDEPTSGLDPTTTEKIHSLLLELKEAGTTIFLTTHNMLEAKELCDRIALLNKGKIVELGAPNAIIDKYNDDKKVHVVFEDDQESIYPFDDLAQLVAQGKAFKKIHSLEPTLANIFIRLTGEQLNA